VIHRVAAQGVVALAAGPVPALVGHQALRLEHRRRDGAELNVGGLVGANHDQRHQIAIEIRVDRDLLGDHHGRALGGQDVPASRRRVVERGVVGARGVDRHTIAATGRIAGPVDVHHVGGL